MADIERSDQQHHPNLHLSPEERRYFGLLFSAADTDKIGVITGEAAVKFFEKTRLSSDVLGEIWQIADTENRGLLTPSGFGIVLRLIGYAQAGRPVSAELSLKPGGPLPRFDGIPVPAAAPAPSAAPLQAQSSGGPIRVPPLTQEKVVQFSALFEESGAQNGLLSGETAKSIFERAQLSNEVLGRIWNLSDTEQRGSLGLTEFIIAMHLLTSFKNGSLRALPQILPAGLYEAAARKGEPRQGTGSRPTSDSAPTIPPQFSGQARQQPGGYQSPMQTGDQWAISPQDKAQFDSIFTTVDTQNRGFITGDQAVTFFSNSRLPEDALAQIWDLADINSEGQLNRDEFAVAMYLIRQQRAKRDNRDLLPQSLPPNLIPPSMRRQPVAPQQPTAPAFDNAANITKPKSASDDLFGLDAISTPPPDRTKATNDPSAFTPTSPTRSLTSPAPQPPPQNATHFKPFIPSSSFGQTIMTPQGTGTSSTGSPTPSRGLPPPPAAKSSGMDDLLGDNDPEVSKKLTNETTELANLSNQVSTLTNQMSEVKTNRGVAEQNFGQAQGQKREFESRLAQIRAAYQQEVNEVQSLEERLRVSKEETRKLQSEMALIQGTHGDLQNQHRQVAEALAADQAENARLKERISLTNSEINHLRPRLEKARLDARQQKGLVAIYKKQLAGSENEKEKFVQDLDGATREHNEATRELEESKKIGELKQSAQSPTAAVASPTPSSGSMNPFFRRSSSATNDRGIASPPAQPSIGTPNHNAFDSFFGSSAPVTSAPPPTSFRSTETPPQSNPGGPAPEELTPKTSFENRDNVTPLASPPSSNFGDSPQNPNEPPAPPQSRQITSSFLPLRPKFDDSGSESSSVRVIPPASRMGEESVSGVETPVLGKDGAVPLSPKRHLEAIASKAPQATTSQAPSTSQASNDAPTDTVGTQEVVAPPGLSPSPGPPSAGRDVPGAFPGDETPDKETRDGPFGAPSGLYSGAGLDPRVDSIQPSSVPAQNQTVVNEGLSKSATSGSNNPDFDSAFSGFDGKGKSPEQHVGGTANGSAAPPKDPGEFPPIRELGGDDESDSDEEKGFDDNFTQGTTEATTQNSTMGGLTPSRPEFSTTNSNGSQLPTPGAQTSPPTYDQTFGSSGTGMGKPDRKDSNQFPAEYSGLLPSREAPASPPASQPAPVPTAKAEEPSSVGVDRGLNFFPEDSNSSSAGPSALGKNISPMSPGASTTAAYAYSQTSPPPVANNPPVPPKTAPAKDDFDDEFGDLTEAKEASDRGDDEIPYSRSRNNDLEDFNPVFDSPAPPRFTGPGSQSSNLPQMDAFASFEASPATGTAAAVAGSNSAAEPAASGTPSHDWDAIFAGLDAPQNSGVAGDLDFSPSKGQTSNATAPPVPPPRANEDSSDDPILKRLTGMGYPRDKSLEALEKYDYNIDKAAEYLISKS